MRRQHWWHDILSLIYILHIEGALALRTDPSPKQFPKYDVFPKSQIENYID
jgi:hypothetical protein